MNGCVKTLGEVRREMKQQRSPAIVETRENFGIGVEKGIYSFKNGYGLWHDGFHETNLMVPEWYDKYAIWGSMYPYVCWYPNEEKDGVE